MAEPGVLKRLDEIEASDSPSNEPQSCYLVKTADVRWLLRLTRALLKSQEDLIEQCGRLASDRGDLLAWFLDAYESPASEEYRRLAYYTLRDVIAEDMSAAIARTEAIRKGGLE